MRKSRLLTNTLVAGACALCAIAAAQVSYKGSELLVNGKSYPARSITERYGAGKVLVMPKAGQADELEAELGKLGVRAERSGSAVILFTVFVPAGFEVQWSDALRDLRGADIVELNTIFYPPGSPTPR